MKNNELALFCESGHFNLASSDCFFELLSYEQTLRQWKRRRQRSARLNHRRPHRFLFGLVKLHRAD